MNLSSYFSDPYAPPLTIKEVRDKIKQYNRSLVQDMTRLSWNVSLEGQRVTATNTTATIRKRLLSTDNQLYYCQSISNVDGKEDLAIKYFLSWYGPTYIIVGEDIFGERVAPEDQHCYSLSVEIQEIKKKILLNRPGFECTHDYDSAQACLYDCQQERKVCNCNATESTAAYNNSEGLWLLDFLEECNESQFNSSCSQSYDNCRAQCKPCVTLNYHFTLTQKCDFNTYRDSTMPLSLRVTTVPIMEVAEQAYSYAASSMLSYIGGLLGLFCGASILSFVQAFLFWWGDGCRIGKGKVEDSMVEDIAKQDNIQSLVQQVALHISHCNLCSTVTARNIQFQKSDEAQTSQRNTGHLANYANNTTIHGIKGFLFAKNKLLKLAWGLFLIASVTLMCEEICRTVLTYIRAPTATTIRVVDLDTYPTIHVCSDNWYNDAQASSYGFTQEELAFIRLAFQEPETYWDDMNMTMKSINGNNTAFDEQKKSVQRKMEQHNLTTVHDMLNLITWNISIPGPKNVTEHISVVKRWRGRVLEIDNSTYVCYSVSNAPAQHDLSIKLPEEWMNYNPVKFTVEFIVVGEDPFAERVQYGYSDSSRYMKLKIWEINKYSLPGKDITCNKGYNSSGVCRQDCASQKDLCNCNGTMNIASYENTEDFFLLASRHDCRDDASCNQNYDRCVEMCKPCTTWDYQVTTTIQSICVMNLNDMNTPLKITMVRRMKISQEYYALPIPSLLSNIGGLMGIFCGASVLSLIQLFLFWWDDGCLPSKTKRTKMNNTTDHINSWLQQAALGIPQCELCKKLTSTRTQSKEGGEVKTSLQTSNHMASYAENTTIHGIKDLVLSKNKLVKLAWGVALLMVFCLMCEEIYRTIRDYASFPTNIDESITLLDKYPPVHFCIFSEWVRDNSKATVKSYGFDDDEIDTIWNFLLGGWPNISEAQRASINRTMEKHNLSTVRDMLNIMTVNLSIANDSMLPDDPAPQKRWRIELKSASLDNYVCYTFSNYTVRDTGLIIIAPFSTGSFVVIGEDPFGLCYDYGCSMATSLEVLLGGSNQLSLINKGGKCSDDYSSSGVCIQDCVSKEAACNDEFNITVRFPSYENNEDFWLFGDLPGYANKTCQNISEECNAKCKLPCTTWTYQSSAVPFNSKNYLSQSIFKLSYINPSMIALQEVYTYPASSLLANIGGLVSLFCGGSLLSIVQVILFCWDNGCCRRKGKESKEETAVISEDDIHKWVQHAALHLT